MELEKYGNIEIKFEDGDATPLYNIKQPKVTESEKRLMADYKKVVSSSDLQAVKNEPEVSGRWEALKERISKKVPKSPHKDFVLQKIVGAALGYGEISVLVDDDSLEEIMINGVNVPIYVYHRKHGMCQTNLAYSTNEALNDLIARIAAVNKKESKPIMDIASIDGNRINVTADPLPSKGSTVTIRKQRRSTFSIVELIQGGTISIELAAFLWLAVEGMKLTPANIIIAGSIGSGKTTTLNALCSFIPPNERVITIEDTLELNLDNIDNKVQLESQDEYDMNALLRDTLRMRPDRVMVGEIRGKEAITLFNAMNIGRVGMGTLHSSSAKEVSTRLESPPMSVPAQIVGSLDLIMVQNKFVYNGEVIRRVTEVAEVTGAIKDTVMMSRIYEWDAKTDKVIRTEEQDLKTPILFLDKLSEATKLDKSKILRELELREAVLKYLVRKGISEQDKVVEIIRTFYLDLAGLIEKAPDLFAKSKKVAAK